MRVSATSVKRWMNCSLQAYFYKNLDLPRRVNAKAAFGTIVHHALDEMAKGADVERGVEIFKDLWEHPDKIGAQPDYWPKYTSYGSLREKGIEILRLYDEKTKWENTVIIASEHKFCVPFGDHELHGFVDRIQVKKAGNGRRTLQIIDFKTSAKAPTHVELRLDQQFTVYMYASLQPEFWMGNGPEFPGIPNGGMLFRELERVDRRGVWFHLMTNKEIDAGPRDDGDFMRLYRVVTEIAAAETAGVYVPKIGEACVWCDYVQQCGITIPNRNELESEVL